MKLIDMKTYPKRNQYNWFIQYQNPAYGFDVDIDCTEVVKESKEMKQSFFPHFLYRIMLAINSIPELKMRVVDGKPYSYDVIHPTFTVMTKQGVYQNCGFEMKENFPLFYQTCRALIDEVKELEVNDELDRFPICKTPNVVFLTSIPTLNFTSMTHPLPIGNQESLSIPRACFGKYYQTEDGHYHVKLNLTVSHVFVDGYPLADCFRLIQELSNKRIEENPVLLK